MKLLLLVLLSIKAFGFDIGTYDCENNNDGFKINIEQKDLVNLIDGNEIYLFFIKDTNIRCYRE